MNGEILSLQTAEKIAKLKKECKQYEEIIAKFDKEVNKQYEAIKKSLDLLKNTPQLSSHDLNTLTKILTDAIEVNNE